MTDEKWEECRKIECPYVEIGCSKDNMGNAVCHGSVCEIMEEEFNTRCKK